MARRRASPLRVVAFGGGTGLSTLLRGLARQGARVAVTAVVAVTDDGGSTGRLRRALGVPALGDARRCVLALAARRDWAALLEHRYGGRSTLGGHALGNLVLAALLEREGSLSRALMRLERLVGARGRVLPATNASPRLVVRLADGRLLRGESLVSRYVGPVERVRFEPRWVVPAPEVIDAVYAADLLVLGPGSLFTSVLASTLAAGVAQAIRRSPARRVLVQNLTTQRGETDDMGVADHARAVLAHLGDGTLDEVLVHAWNGQPPPNAVVPDRHGLARLGIREVLARVSSERGRGRLHSPDLLVRALLRLASDRRGSSRRRQPA